MKPIACMVMVVVLIAAGSAAGQPAPSADLAAEILRRIPEWPGIQVEVPTRLYYDFVRESTFGPAPLKPPEAGWIERVSWTVRIAETEATIEAAFDVICLPGAPLPTIRLLPQSHVWRDILLDGKPLELLRTKDGWFNFVPAEPARYRITARATVKPTVSGDESRVAFAIPRAALTTGGVESDGTWEVTFKGGPQPIVGDAKGTRGTVGLVPTEQFDVSWRRPRPAVHREARIETTSDVGWTLADGVHQVRAVMNVRLWGGEVQELKLSLPPGADRVAITGPDVREVQVQGGEARVFLRGAIVQRTRLNVAFDVPRAATGRMGLPGFGVVGGSNRGGTLAIAGGAGGVLLELESPGLSEMALRDLPDEIAGLLSAPVVYAYKLGVGAWEGRVDLVGMSEFPVRETLVDAALYTVLFRPDGHVMTKVLYEVRNRAQQYMKVELPAGAQLVVARVAEQQRNLARGPDNTVLVPLEKSVLTTAGLISFPVEIVYLMPGPRLEHQGKFRLPLPRTDLPVAYARCAMMLPEGMKAREWQGTLKQVPKWSSETAELEFEYGRGHLAVERPPDVVPRAQVPNPGAVFGHGVAAPGIAGTWGVELNFETALPQGQAQQAQRQAGEVDEGLSAQQQMIQGKNYYRAGFGYYQRGNYEKAGELFNKVVEVAPNSSEAENARKFLGNVSVALGKEGNKAQGEDRTLRAATKAIQRTQQLGNVRIVEQQEQLLEQAEQSIKAGDVSKAEAAYKVAVNLSGKLQTRGEAAQEQEATVRKAKEFLEKRDRGRQEEVKELEVLQKEVASLKQNIVTKGGDKAAQVVDALVEPDLFMDTGQGQGMVAGTGRGTAAVHYGGAAVTVRQPAQPRQPVGQRGLEPPAQPAEQHRLDPPQAGGQPSPTRQPAGPQQAMRQLAQQAPSERSELRADPQQDMEQDMQPALPAVQIAGGNALAEQQVMKGKSGGAYRYGVAAGGRSSGPGSGPGSGAAAGDQLQRLKQQVEQLKNIQSELTTTYDVDGNGTADVKGERYAEHAKLAPSPSSSSLGRQLSEKAKGLSEQAKEVTDLARQGRLVEARQLVQTLERDQETTRRATAALTKTGTGTLTVEAGALVEMPSDPAHRLGDLRVTQDQLRLGAITDARTSHEEGRPVKTPDSKPAAVDEFADVKKAEESLERAKDMLQKQARDLDKVQINVEDLAQGNEDGRRLAEFVRSNYAWAFVPPAGHRTANAPVGGQTMVNAPAGQTMVNAGNLALNLPQDVNGGQVFLNGAEGVNTYTGGTIQVTNGNLSVANDPNAVQQVQVILERLRTNMGQQVAVGSRNIFVDEDVARGAGLGWQAGVNGVRYAVINEGQLLALMDIEQRQPPSAQQAANLPRDVRQQAIVGTQAVLGNGGRVTISLAGDSANTLFYNGNPVAVSHDDYLLVDNGGYVTAVKSGRMQHWTTEAEPVRFPGVPAAVTVPTVGTTVKFEKTLLDASDSLELVTDYTWQGDER